ncbi:hypothetical protein D3C87_460270 [compost metagenome]
MDITTELGEVRYYTEDDVYHYSVDNRPLQDLASNDGILQAAIDALVNAFNNGLFAKHFVAGTDFTAGTTTTLALGASAPTSATGLWVFFNDKFVTSTSYALNAGNIIFNVAIPVGTTTVDIKWSSIGFIGNGQARPEALSGIQYNSAGSVSAFVAGSDSYTVSYTASGDVNTVVGGGYTQTINYDASGNVIGVSIS